MAKKKQRIATDTQGAAPLNDAFSALADLRAQLPDGETVQPAVENESQVQPATGYRFSGKITLRRETKGRRGKTVTRVSGLDLSSELQTKLTKTLKQSLGCGASVEGPDILLQGEQAPQAKKVLEGLGAKRVVIGN